MVIATSAFPTRFIASDTIPSLYSQIEMIGTNFVRRVYKNPNSPIAEAVIDISTQVGVKLPQTSQLRDGGGMITIIRSVNMAMFTINPTVSIVRGERRFSRAGKNKKA